MPALGLEAAVNFIISEYNLIFNNLDFITISHLVHRTCFLLVGKNKICKYIYAYIYIYINLVCKLNLQVYKRYLTKRLKANKTF